MKTLLSFICACIGITASQDCLAQEGLSREFSQALDEHVAFVAALHKKASAIENGNGSAILNYIQRVRAEGRAESLARDGVFRVSVHAHGKSTDEEIIFSEGGMLSDASARNKEIGSFRLSWAVVKASGKVEEKAVLIDDGISLHPSGQVLSIAYVVKSRGKRGQAIKKR